LLANIALSVLDEHLMAPWKPDGAMGSKSADRLIGCPPSADARQLSAN
jgi:hypothetical protein